MRSVCSMFMVVFLFYAEPGRAQSEPVILVLGDSLSAAYEMELSESWPSLLQNRLIENGHAYRVFNSSIVGDTTQSGLARLPRLLSEYHPQAVIIELGGNDGLRGLPLATTQGNLQAMIVQSQAAGAHVVLAGIRLPPNYGTTYTQRFSAMYVELANGGQVQFIPFLLEGIALDSDLMLPDGIHPTAQAQPMLLDNVWQALEPVLQ